MKVGIGETDGDEVKLNGREDDTKTLGTAEDALVFTVKSIG